MAIKRSFCVAKWFIQIVADIFNNKIKKVSNPDIFKEFHQGIDELQKFSNIVNSYISIQSGGIRNVSRLLIALHAEKTNYPNKIKEELKKDVNRILRW